jgi:cytochrome c biogenesis protein CcmG/thiol:disulfide interchange protein DsbE
LQISDRLSSGMMRRFLFLVPIAVVAALAAVFGVRMLAGGNPATLPSNLIDKPAPAFALPPIAGDGPGLVSSDLGGRPVLINIFASWCVPCLAEHPVITRLGREQGVTVFGINYKDKPEDAEAWLARNGNPYARIGADRDGRTGIDFGVYGVPETFVIDAEGRIRYRYPGPLIPDVVEREILPLLAALAQR